MTKFEKIIHGDCLDMLKTMKDNSVDSVGIEREAEYIEIIEARTQASERQAK